MIKNFTASLFMLIVLMISTTKAQSSYIYDFPAIEKIALQMPDSLSNSTTNIASYFTQNFKTEHEKARAAFVWIANNIQYDIENIFAINFYETKEEKIINVLKNKKGICENYAFLYTQICLDAGLKAVTIEGYTKQNGSMDYLAHAWCAVSIDSTWFLVDPTWGAGYIDNNVFVKKINDDFFKVSPHIFVKTHMPFDYLWQFLKYPITNQEFYEGKTEQNKNKPLYNFTDSLQAYQQQSKTEQAKATVRRVKANGLKNSLIFDRLHHLEVEIENDKIKQNNDLYNSAIANFNNAINTYNEYIKYKNKQFIPQKPDSEIQKTFDLINVKLALSQDNLTQLKIVGNSDLSIMKVPLNKSIDEFLIQTKHEEQWLKKYFSTKKIERKMMFYTKIK